MIAVAEHVRSEGPHAELVEFRYFFAMSQFYFVADKPA